MERISLTQGACWACKRLFWYDPNRVVMVAIDPFAKAGGRRAPMCHLCCIFANPWRKAFGMVLLSEIDTSGGRELLSEGR